MRIFYSLCAAAALVLLTGAGTASADPIVEGDLRLRTIVSSFASQPTLEPVVQQGGQDDCVRFSVEV